MVTSRSACVVVLCSLAASASAQIEGLGTVEFPNSGAREAQEDFVRGALLLHSFAYEDAAEAFRAAQEVDPGFALAYWGEALTHCHPIWQEENRTAARDVLKRLAPTAEERLAKAPTEREKGLLAAVEVLFGEGEREQRLVDYSAAMAALHERFPDDLEIAAFSSVALLGSATDGRDVPIYMRAAAIAEQVLQEKPDHPGALHYAIHGFDDPVHAALGLRMARRYGVVAPAADHALHMPSHIYVALGMWADSAAANEASSAAADARRARKELGLDARGFHSLLWLLYSYLQLGRVGEAQELLDDMVRDAKDGNSKRTRSHLAQMRAAFVVATDGWQGPAARIEVDLAELEPPTAAADLFIQGCCALERGEHAQVEALLETMRARRQATEPGAQAKSPADCCAAPSTSTYGPGRKAALVMEGELQGLLELRKGDVDRGLALLRQAALDEDAIGYDFGPPVVVKPAHELLAEQLAALGRTEEAHQEFKASLERAPRRSRSLLGLARTAADPAVASAAYADLARSWQRADPDLPALEEVRGAAAAER